MQDSLSLQAIAHIHTDFPSKFGVPRQSGLVSALKATIVFEPDFRNPEAFRGLEEYSHIWLIWQFSQVTSNGWSPTVRPPRLGGNTRMGVFATRSPFRPNRIGLSCVRLDKVEFHPANGPVLHVSGADLVDGTPIYDVKPYLPYTDSHPEAIGGFAAQTRFSTLEVVCPESLLEQIPSIQREGLLAVLAQDPRPAYQNDPQRIYGMAYGNFEVRFTVEGNCLSVREIFRRT